MDIQGLIHFGPMHAIIYADGYVRAFNSLCGDVLKDDFSDCDLRIDFVNCKRCNLKYKRKSKSGIDVKATIKELSRISNKVYKTRCIYDEKLNNINRFKLGLDEFHIESKKFIELIEAEDKIREEYKKQKEEYHKIVEFAKQSGIEEYEIETTTTFDVRSGLSVRSHKIIVK